MDYHLKPLFIHPSSRGYVEKTGTLEENGRKRLCGRVVVIMKLRTRIRPSTRRFTVDVSTK